jgi:hypothetical protein
MNDGEKKLFAIVIVIIMIGTLIASLSLQSPALFIKGGKDRGYLWKFMDNVAMSDTPEPNNEPHIAVNPNDPNHLVAACNDYGTPNSDAWIGYYYSFDGGKTWTRELLPGYLGGPPSELTGFDLSGDAVVCFDSNGNVFISGLMAKRDRNPINPIGFGFNLGRADGIFVAKSTDGGVTFNQINIIVTALQTMISFHDKEWMAVDLNNGNVYVVWVVFTLLMVANVMFSRSTDNGNSYSTPMLISEYQAGEFSSQGSTIQVDPEGNVHVAWIDFNEGSVRYTSSTDQGQSFSTPQSISDVDDIPRDALPNSDYRTPTLLMSAVDLSETNTSGSLYITWNDYRYGDADILMIISRDGGGSWSEPIRVNNDTEGNGKDQFFSAVAVSTQGYVHLIFYDRRDDEENTLLSIYYAMSMDGGENFTFQANMTDQSFDGNNAPHPFIGDYIGLAASNSSAYGVWCDTREGTPETGDSELYFGRVDFGYRDDEIFMEDEE